MQDARVSCASYPNWLALYRLKVLALAVESPLVMAAPAGWVTVMALCLQSDAAAACRAGDGDEVGHLRLTKNIPSKFGTT